MPPIVAIAGAGLSGLVLARILSLHGIPVTVFERDSGPDARRQGGSLDIHDDSGQVALRAAGLLEEFRKHTHPQGENTRVMDKHATVLVDRLPPGGEGARPEIDRTILRTLLIDSLPDGTIVWGRTLVGARPLGDGRHEIRLDDGATETVDLLVGADGTWSKVRALVSAAVPQYSGISHVEVLVSDAKARRPDLAALVGPGMIFALGDGKGILGHGGDRIEVGFSVRVPEDWTDTVGVDWNDAPAAREVLLAEFAGWDESLKELVRASDDTITPRRIYALPIGHRWARVPGVTLIGDAAHVMPPYAGEGANLAMLDGAELAESILTHRGDLETALTDYETAMFARARQSAEESAQGLAMCFNAEAPSQLVEFFSVDLGAAR